MKSMYSEAKPTKRFYILVRLVSPCAIMKSFKIKVRLECNYYLLKVMCRIKPAVIQADFLPVNPDGN